MFRAVFGLLSLTSLALSSPLILQTRDAPLNDSITYCSSKDRGNDEEYYIPCTKTSHPLSEVIGWLPYKGTGNIAEFGRFAAHYECYVETVIGDRYLAGHAFAGAVPCWVTASLLGSTSTCPNPVPEGSRCGCDKNQLASCCAFRAAGQDFNGYINATYAYCPA